MAYKTFILSDEMRSSKSGFFIEGTDIEMDYPDKYPLPMETEVIEDEGPVAIRVLPNCPYLEKEKQLKNGFPASYNYTENDRKKLTFIHARLSLDEKRDKTYIDFLMRTAWLKGNEHKKTRNNTRTIYQEYDESILVNAELQAEEMIINAKNKVFALGEGEVKDLYRLAVGGNYVESQITISQMRKHLLAIAGTNPEFITSGIKTNRDRITVLLNKALEHKIIALDTPGSVHFFSPASNQWVKLVDLSDAHGIEVKFDKFVEFLMTELGHAELSIIENRINEIEGVEQPPEEMFEHEGDKKKKQQPSQKK